MYQLWGWKTICMGKKETAEQLRSMRCLKQFLERVLEYIVIMKTLFISNLKVLPIYNSLKTLVLWAKKSGRIKTIQSYHTYFLHEIFK